MSFTLSHLVDMISLLACYPTYSMVLPQVKVLPIESVGQELIGIALQAIDTSTCDI